MTGFTERTSGGSGGDSGSIVAVSIATGCVFLLLFTVTRYIIKRRRAVCRRAAGKLAHGKPTKISTDD